MEICAIEVEERICGAVGSLEIAKRETFHFLIHKEQASCCRDFPNYRSLRWHMQKTNTSGIYKNAPHNVMSRRVITQIAKTLKPGVYIIDTRKAMNNTDSRSSFDSTLLICFTMLLKKRKRKNFAFM